jgi:hypothetical protein
MKRDMDLIRQLLKIVEERTVPNTLEGSSLSLDGYTLNQIFAHLAMLEDAGFIEGQSVDALSEGTIEYYVHRLTWRGHEFLEAARSDTIWQKAKVKVAAAGGSVSIAVMSELLGALGKEALGLK